MNTLLVIIFIIKILARSKLFNVIREKHGQDTLRAVRYYERQLRRLEKLKDDLRFLLKCKKEHLTPNFAKPRFSIKTDRKTTARIGRIILETEIGNKHKTKKKIEEKLATVSSRLATKLTFLEYKAIQYRLRTNVSKQKKKWNRTQEKKLEALRKESKPDPIAKPLPNIVHNFSTYALSNEEHKALAHGLEHYVPERIDKRKLEV